MAEGNEGQFDRRKEDVNVSALAVRVRGLEGRMELVEQGLHDNREELRENTKLTTRTNTLLDGTQEVLGIRQKVDEVYDIFDTTRSGFRLIGRTGDWIDRNGRRAFWFGAFAVAAWTYWKTGHLPEWARQILGI